MFAIQKEQQIYLFYCQRLITIGKDRVCNLGVIDGDSLRGGDNKSDEDQYLFIYHKINNKTQTEQLAMGNQTIQQTNKIRYQSVQSPHSMLNNTFLYQVKNQEFIKSQWPFFSQQQFNSWQKKYKAFLLQIFQVQELIKCKQATANNLFLPLSYNYTKVTICSPSGIVTMNYQRVKSSLIELIEQKSKLNEPFLETQIWKILLILTQTFSYVHAKSIVIGDVRAQNILIDLGKNKVKMSTQLSWIGEKPFQEKVLTNEDIFLSPEISESVLKKEKLSYQLLMDNDDFTLGLTLSECLLLEDLSKIYETKESFRHINKEKYAQMIDKILKIKYYSLKLKMVIIGMIQLLGDMRLSSRQIFDLIRDNKRDILDNKDFNLTKEQFQGLLSQKYSALQKIMNQFKSKTNRQMFQNKELFTSRAITINGISTVRNNKKTYDDTFNLDLLDLSRGDPGIVPPKNLQLSAVDGNRSWSIDLKQNSFISKYKCSEVGDMNTKKIEFTPEKSAQKKKKQIRYLKIDDHMAESEVKQMNSFKKQFLQPSLMPVTNYTISQEKQYYRSPELKIYDGKEQETDNFSFHSPQSRLKVAKQDMKQGSHKKSLFEAKSISNSSETLLLVPSVYAVSNPPQSYISYHYSKSIQNKKYTKESMEQSENQMSLNLQGLQNLKTLRQFSQQQQNNYQTFGAPSNHFRRKTVNEEPNNQVPFSLYNTRSEQKRNVTY